MVEVLLLFDSGFIPVQQKRRRAIRTPPQIKNGSTQAAVLRPFCLIVFLSLFAANSLATAFWSFSASTR
jgi:hypothetical protein